MPLSNKSGLLSVFLMVEISFRQLRRLLGIFAIVCLAVTLSASPNFADFHCTPALMPPLRPSASANRYVLIRVHLLVHELSPPAFDIVHEFS